MTKQRRSVRRSLALLVYYGLATHLPPYYRPLGRFGRWLRQVCARPLLADCGAWINVEPRVDLGDGSLVSIGDQSGIGRDSRIEGLAVGERVMIGPELLAIVRNHRYDDPVTPVGWQGVSDIAVPSIGDDSWVGARVILLPGVRIGRHCVIGAGAVVTRDVPDGCLAAGNPARVIRSIVGDAVGAETQRPGAARES